MDYKELRENIAKNFYSKYAQDLSELAKMASKNDIINPKLYEKYDVKRGLRDVNGNGVVCGLTEISEIQAFKKTKTAPNTPPRDSCTTAASRSANWSKAFPAGGSPLKRRRFCCCSAACPRSTSCSASASFWRTSAFCPSPLCETSS